MRASEYMAYSGKLLGFCEISAATFTGPSHERPIEYTPKITANTETNIARSIRTPHARGEPAGRGAAGGSGVWCFGRGEGEGTGSSGLGERQFSAGSVVIEKLGVTSPLDGCF